MSGKICLASNFCVSRSVGESQVLQILLAHDESEGVRALKLMKFARWRRNEIHHSDLFVVKRIASIFTIC